MIGIELPLSRSVLVNSSRDDANRVASFDRRLAGPGESASLIARNTKDASSGEDEEPMEVSPLRELFQTRKYLVCSLYVLPTAPLVFRRVGIIPGIALMFLVGGFSNSALPLCEVDPRTLTTRRMDQRDLDINAVFKSCARLSVLILHLGYLVALQVLLRDTAASVIDLRHAHNALLAFIVLVSSPLWLRDTHWPIFESSLDFALRLRPALGMLSALFLCATLSLRAYQRSQIPHAHQPVEWVSTELDLLSALPIVVMGFVEMRQYCSVMELLRPQPVQKHEPLLLQLKTVLFMIVGVCGYVFAGRETTGNVWLYLPPKDALTQIGKIMYCGFLWLSIAHTFRKGEPTVHYDAPSCMDVESSNVTTRSIGVANQGSWKRNSLYTSLEGGTTSISKSDEGLSEEEGFVLQLQRSPCPTDEHLLAGKPSIPVLASTFLIATFVQHVENVWGFLGSTVGFWLSFTFPLVYQLHKLRNHDSQRYWMPSKDARLAGVVLLSLLLSVVCTTHVLRKR